MPKFWEFKKIENSAGSDAELLLYGPISQTSWWGDEITPKEFATELKALGDVKQLNVRINSVGGDVFAANAIYAMLERHTANITVYIDGLAASAATIIALAADIIKMPKNAMMMIHNPMSGLWGNANEMREFADFLDKVRETLLAVYQEKTKKSKQEIIDLMDAETWMTAKEAFDLGFVDEIEGQLTAVASIDGKMLNINGQSFDVSSFKNLSKLNINNVKKPNIEVSRPQISNINEPKVEVETPEISNINTNTEEKNVPGLTLDILNKENPEIVQQIKDSAVKEERERLQAIDELPTNGHKELIAKAKYENPISAEALSMQIIKAEQATRQQIVEDTKDDAEVLNDISSVDTSIQSKDKSDDIAVKIAAGANKRR